MLFRSLSYVSFIGDGPGKDDVSDTGQGKKAVIFRLDPDAYHQLKQIAFDQGKTVQALMCEAVNRIFIENGLPGIAQ